MAGTVKFVERWDATAVDRWDRVTGSWSGNGERQWYQPGEAWVSAGELVIRARRDSTGKIVSARLHSKQKLYGHYTVEASVKYDAFQGAFPAFWLLDVPDSNSWPLCGEIDIVERINATDTAHTNAHMVRGSGATASHYQTPASKVVTPGAHKYSVTVNTVAADPYIVWRIDGQLVKTVRKGLLPADVAWPFTRTRGLNAVINFAVGGSWPGDPLGSWQGPAYLKVGAVTVWDGDPYTA